MSNTQTTVATPYGAAADTLYDGIYSAAIGGSVVALFFMVFDLIQQQPMFTPSLMGTVLFEGGQASDVFVVRLDMVAYFTMVHFALFGVLGLGTAMVLHRVETHSHRPTAVLLALFVIVEAGFFAGAYALMPSVVARVGVVWIGLANLLAAGSMGLFLLSSHHPTLWSDVKRKVLPRR